MAIVVSSFGFTITSVEAEPPQIQEIMEYWFGSLSNPEEYPADKVMLWFSGKEEIDQEIRFRFEELVLAAANHELDYWKETPRGRLALIILLDQFTRNIFRGTSHAFAYDAIVQDLTIEGLIQRDDQALLPIERVFFYLPLEHAENMELQELSVKKFHSLLTAVPLEQLPKFNSFEDYAWRHYDIISKFGRFPHRNAILGRESTPEEVEFLKGPNSSF